VGSGLQKAPPAIAKGSLGEVWCSATLLFDVLLFQIDDDDDEMKYFFCNEVFFI